MAIQNIAIGTPGAGGGDPAYAAFTKINQNFSNQQHAASRMVGTQAGNVMEVGAFGFGGTQRLGASNPYNLDASLLRPTQMISFNDTGLVDYGQGLSWSANNRLHAVIGGLFTNGLFHVCLANATVPVESRQITYSLIRTAANSIVDGNGFIKAASPIVQLYSDKIELNDEAQLQEIVFEKLGVGDYLIKGSSGFAQEGWYIETPKDANGNVLFSVIYTTLENGDISVKTYKKKFDFETVSIVADLDNPVDITKNRWIDLRLQELPQPKIEMPESITPPNFQPTGLAEAVATVMESYHDPE